jgi:hypothetical protein
MWIGAIHTQVGVEWFVRKTMLKKICTAESDI